MRTGEAAIAWGRSQITSPSQSWYRLCLKFVRSCYDIPAMYPDAGKAWDAAKLKHRTSDPMAIPRGAPVHFEMSSVADHIALGLGRGLCLTNDFGAGNAGKIVVARIADICTQWNAQLLGWSEDLNGKQVYTPAAPPAEKPAAAVPTILDLTIALERLEAASNNPDAAAAFEHAQLLLGYIAGDSRVRVPATLHEVLVALRAKEPHTTGDPVKNSRIKSAIALLEQI